MLKSIVASQPRDTGGFLDPSPWKRSLEHTRDPGLVLVRNSNGGCILPVRPLLWLGSGLHPDGINHHRAAEHVHEVSARTVQPQGVTRASPGPVARRFPRGAGGCFIFYPRHLEQSQAQLDGVERSLHSLYLPAGRQARSR